MYEHSSEIKQLFRTAGGPLLSYQHVNIAKLPILATALMAIYRQKYKKNYKIVAIKCFSTSPTTETHLSKNEPTITYILQKNPQRKIFTRNRQ